MTFEEWADKYRPMKNHINGNASMDGCMFETYSPELDYVRSRRESLVWTWVEDDDGHDMIVPGYHLVNRIGYLIATRPNEEAADFEGVYLDDEEDRADREKEWARLKEEEADA